VITLKIEEVPGHTAAEVQQRLEAVRRTVPQFLKRIAYATTATVKRLAVANASNLILKRRTGALVGWTQQQQPVGGPGFVEWGLPQGDPESRIGLTLDRGATITPKVGSYLRIPLSGGPALTSAGVDLYAGVRLRTVGGFFALRLRSGGGSLILYRKDARTLQLQPWYALVRSVTVPPHPWFTRAVEEAFSVVPVIIESRLHDLETAKAAAESE
jgi:hypothetical protein